MEKALFILLKKGGFCSGDDKATQEDVQRYKDMYKKPLPGGFVDMVTALVDAGVPTNIKMPASTAKPAATTA